MRDGTFFAFLFREVHNGLYDLRQADESEREMWIYLGSVSADRFLEMAA
jgi:hypothetical protein